MPILTACSPARSGWAVVLCAAAIACGQRARGADDADPRRILAGLKLTAMGEVWVVPEEIELRRHAESLERLEREYYQAKAQVEEHIKANDAAAKTWSDAKTKLEKTRTSLNDEAIVGAERRKLEETARQQEKEVRDLRARWRDENQLGEHPPVRAAVVRLVAVRNALTLSVLAIRRLEPMLPPRYGPLRINPAVRTALAALGERHRLGPARDYQADLKRLPQVQRIVFSNEVPVFREDRHFRVSLLVNDQTPAVFSIRHSTGPTVIPASLATAAGIKIDTRAPTSTYIADAQRRFTVHAVTIPRMRLAGAVLENVSALVLPPEGEDLGAKLGQNAYSQLDCRIDGRRLVMRVTMP
jgi:predicted aspartyl protease